ncbi:hypothetical protein [Streptomyces lavendulae]|uniref:hypothetical protein n=1 Tax=Streptomyces lavendulae TaxID=1914 RepID=UPI0038102019
MRAASEPPADGGKSGPDDALRAVRRTEQAGAHHPRTAGHSGSAGHCGQKAAVGRRVGWSRQHVTTPAGTCRAGEPDQQERAEAA